MYNSFTTVYKEPYPYNICMHANHFFFFSWRGEEGDEIGHTKHLIVIQTFEKLVAKNQHVGSDVYTNPWPLRESNSLYIE